MKKIIGVRFKKPGKIYFFDPQDLEVEMGEKVIVETAMGDEIGEVVINNREEINNYLETIIKENKIGIVVVTKKIIVL